MGDLYSGHRRPTARGRATAYAGSAFRQVPRSRRPFQSKHFSSESRVDAGKNSIQPGRMKNYFYVYAYFRPDDGSPCYIGKGCGDRWRVHLKRSRNIRLRRIIDRANGDIPHVKIRQGLTESEAFKIEVALIKAIGRGELGPLVNLTDGGDGTSGSARVLSAEHRRKIGEAQKGRRHSSEALAKMSAAKLGRKKLHPMSIDTRAKIGAKNRGKARSPELRKRLSEANFGHTHTAEAKAKIGRSTSIRNIGNKHFSGKSHSLESREKIRSAIKRHWSMRKALTGVEPSRDDRGASGFESGPYSTTPGSLIQSSR